MLTTSDGKLRVELEAHSGAVRAFDKAGHLTVEINGEAGEISVRGKSIKAADYVFADGYHLTPLAQVERFIAANGHLPGVPKGETMEKDGISLNQFTMTLLEKIEELTLHTIAQDRRIATLEKKLARRK